MSDGKRPHRPRTVGRTGSGLRAGRTACLLAISLITAVASIQSAHHHTHSPAHPLEHITRRPASSRRTPTLQRRPVAAGHPASLAAAQPTLTSARAVALGFARGWLGCVYLHAPCSQIPGLLPAYARRINPQLAAASVTGADLATHPRIISLTFAHSCRVEAVATVTYTADGYLLELHPNLVREPGGWQVFAIPELPLPVLAPAPLHSGERLC